jgi:sugar phosphate isomerase/epimerase
VSDGAHAGIGIFARTFPGATPDVVLRQVRDAGYTHVQYNMVCSGLASLPLHVPTDALEALRAASARHDVTLSALSATYNMIHPDPAARATGQAALVVLAGAARSLGIPVLTLCAGSRNAADQWGAHPDNRTPTAWHDLRASIDAALEIAERHCLVLAVEPEPSSVVDSAVTAQQLLREVGSARLGVILDSANLLEPAYHTTPASRLTVLQEAVDLLGERIVLVHAKDRAADGRFVAAGEGVVDFGAFFAALERAKVRAPVVTHDLPAAQAASAAAYLHASRAGARALA